MKIVNSIKTQNQEAVGSQSGGLRSRFLLIYVDSERSMSSASIIPLSKLQAPQEIGMKTTKVFILIAIGTLNAVAQTLTPTPTPSSTTTFSRPTLTLPSCWALEESLSITGAPPPPMDMSELGVSFALGSLYNTADPCRLPAVTGSSAKEFSEWASDWTSWQAQHVSEFRVVWEACSDDPAITDLVPVGPDACSTLKAKITGGLTGDDSDGDDKDENAKNDDSEMEDVKDSIASRVTSSLLTGLLAVYALAFTA